MTHQPKTLYGNMAPHTSPLQEEGDLSVTIFDADNPVSVYSKLPKKSAERMKTSVNLNLLGLPEETLRTKIRPTKVLNMLRLSFWYEYDRAVATNRPMVVRRIYAGICSHENFMTTYWCNGSRLAWILTPVSGYQASLEEALETSISQMRKILDVPLFKDRNCTQLDYKAAELILKVHDRLDQRVNGSVVQRSESKQLTVHRHVGGDGKKTKDDIITVENIDDKIKELEEKTDFEV